MGNRPAHGPCHTKALPPEPLSDTGTFARTSAPQPSSVVTCKGARANSLSNLGASELPGNRQSYGTSSGRRLGSFAPLRFFPARQVVSLCLVAKGTLSWASREETGTVAHLSRAFSLQAGQCSSPAVKRLGVRSGVTEARWPLGLRQRWGLWIVGRWPSLTRRFLEGAALWQPPFVGVATGSGPSTLGPYAAGSSAPFAGVSGGNPLRADRILEGSSGGNWMAVRVPPVRRRYRCGWALVRPIRSNILEPNLLAFRGGLGLGDPVPLAL
jgi:hypothetical protein